MTDKIVPLINAKFCDTETLDGYDAEGNPGPGVTHEIANAKVKELSLKLEACSKDAERYRWLKTHHLRLGPDTWIRTGEDLDEAIDAELLTKEPAP